MSEQLSRKELLRGLAAVGAVGATTGLLAGCKSEEGGVNIPEKWDRETDVLVIGYGMAGACAALAADTAGSEVLILEKMPEKWAGGNSKVSANLIFIPDNRDDGIAYFRGMNEGHMLDMPDEIVQTWIDEMMANRAWLADLGVELIGLPASAGMSPELPHLPGAETMVIYSVAGNFGNAVLWTPVSEEVAARRLEIAFETPAKKLVANAAGEVIGAIATSGGADIAIKAKKAVILTCGSFEFDEAMKANFLHAPCYSVGTPGNTGDGARMAQALGADLWHMNNAMGPIAMGYFTEDLGPDWAKTPIWLMMPGNSYIMVDKYGHRFMNERRPADHGHGWDDVNYYEGNKGEYPRIPCWIVFDETIRTTAAIHTGSGGGAIPGRMSFFGHHSGYEWSADNSAEVDRGWILKGDTVEELAGKMGLDPAVLAETVAAYNGYAEAGADADFGRAAAAMKPLQGPFYAIQSWPTMVNTQGGPRRNHKAQVMHVDGHPIPRLYSAGECGSVYAWQYQGGGNLGECVAFGRIAGTNAANEESL